MRDERRVLVNRAIHRALRDSDRFIGFSREMSNARRRFRDGHRFSVLIVRTRMITITRR